MGRLRDGNVSPSTRSTRSRSRPRAASPTRQRETTVDRTKFVAVKAVRTDAGTAVNLAEIEVSRIKTTERIDIADGRISVDALSKAFMADSSDAYRNTVRRQWRQMIHRGYPDAAGVAFAIDALALLLFLKRLYDSGLVGMPTLSLYAFGFSFLLVIGAFISGQHSHYLWMGGSISYVLANRWSNCSFLVNTALTIAACSMYYLTAELNDNLGIVKDAFTFVPVAYLMIILSPIPREFNIDADLGPDLVKAGFLIESDKKYFFNTFLLPTYSRALHFASLFTAVGLTLFVTKSVFSPKFFMFFCLFCMMNGLLFFKPALWDSSSDVQEEEHHQHEYENTKKFGK
jgi:hypothetical protein